MNSFLRHAAFVAGLAVLAWVGIGYVGSNTLALAITALIAAFYGMGVLDLHRFRQATATLAEAVAELPDRLADLRPFLARVHPSLQNAVRRRVEGEPVGLPGPAMAPYLAGLLVLLGMLGTFVGMVLTLRGTGLALDSATDLQAVRGALVAPVKGLGLAFGTSVAGVATSAALGLLSALSRRERVAAAQALDARIATTLRVFSVAHQREESLRLMRQQAELMPALVDGLRGVMDALAQQADAAHARQLANQAGFHERVEASYTGLAASVDRALRDSLAESARIAGATIRPVVEATLDGIARETAALHATLADTARGQVDQLSTRFEAVAGTVAQSWETALVRHETTSHGLAAELHGALDRAAQAFEQRSGALLDGVAQRSGALLDAVAERHAEAQAAQAARLVDAARDGAALQARIAEDTAARLDGVSTRLDETVDRVAAALRDTTAQHAQASTHLAAEAERALVAAAGAFEGHAARLLRGVESAHASLQEAAAARDERSVDALASLQEAAIAREEQRAAAIAALQEAVVARDEQRAAAIVSLQDAAAARDQDRVAAMTQALEAMAATLQGEWRVAGAESLARQQQLADAMERTAREITTEAGTQARETIAEIGRLVEAASEAPRAAAEVIAELREKLSDSMVRDNALLDDRARMLETLGTLLDGVNQAAREQRGAIDALVGSSAEMLERVGARFGERVEAETAKLDGIAAQVTGGAAEVASLGEAFGAAVAQFGQSNETLVAQLQRIDGALAKSLARSDEQLAYYVAQAREVVDLSILSQKQIIEELQRLAGRAALAEAR